MKCTHVLFIVLVVSNVRASLKWHRYPLEITTVSDYTNTTDEPPPPRAHAAISYAVSMQFFAIFGGQTADGSATDDTFVLDAVASESTSLVCTFRSRTKELRVAFFMR